ncbi:MAG: hypothetical protein M3Z29_11470 [Pseudomonadota bacterium]|nr:hypothetical protein [Pseudomonadota bacterium]
MIMSTQSIHRARKAAFAAAFAFAAVAAVAQTAMAMKEDAAQLNADQAALQRQVKRLDADEARLKSDTASGRMSAESKDAYAVYTGKQAVTGEKRDIAADKEAGPQMKADKAALQRQIKRLEVAEARMKSDTASGRMAAESKDAEKVYKDKLVVPAEKKEIAIDRSNMSADQKK